MYILDESGNIAFDEKEGVLTVKGEPDRQVELQKKRGEILEYLCRYQGSVRSYSDIFWEVNSIGERDRKYFSESDKRTIIESVRVIRKALKQAGIENVDELLITNKKGGYKVVLPSQNPFGTVSAGNTSMSSFCLDVLSYALYEGEAFSSWANLSSPWRSLLPYADYDYHDRAEFIKRLFSRELFSQLELDSRDAEIICNGQAQPTLLAVCYRYFTNVDYLRMALSSCDVLIGCESIYQGLCSVAEIVFSAHDSGSDMTNRFLRSTSWQNSGKALLLLVLAALFGCDQYIRFASLVGTL